MGFRRVGLLMHVLDGRRHFLTDFDTHVAQVRFRASQRFNARVPTADVTAKAEPLVARVHQNMWIVDCPDCGSAAMCWFDDDSGAAHPFMCDNCLNNSVDNRWRPVAAPTAAERRGIESVLQARPVPQTRNWYPHESLVDLIDENLAHNLAVAKGVPQAIVTPDVEG